MAGNQQIHDVVAGTPNRTHLRLSQELPARGFHRLSQESAFIDGHDNLYHETAFPSRQTLRENHNHLRLSASAMPASVSNRLQTPFGKFIFSSEFETFGGMVVLMNFAIMTIETHARALNDGTVMDVVIHLNRMLLVYYAGECLARLFLLRGSFFFGGWNNLDFVIVVTGILGEAMEAFAGGASSIEQLKLLKSLRLLRLVRLIRLLVAFRELYILIAGLARCMKTLFWSSGLIFLVLNVWSIMSVEYMDETVKELTAAGHYDTCSWCPTAFENIWYANLTWFQIITGDGWSILGRPMVEIYVWPYIFFVTNVFVVMWGLLNLIVAAIVESSIAAREDDIVSASKMAEQHQAEVLASFTELCSNIDEDGSGEITIEEFMEAWKTNRELQQHLTIMGVQPSEMEHLLGMMDTDGSGTLDNMEFVEQFTRMRTLVMKTEMYYVSRYVENIQRSMNEHKRLMGELMKGMHTVKQELKAATSVSTNPPSTAADQADVSSHEQSTNGTWPQPGRTPTGWYYFGSSPVADPIPFSKVSFPNQAQIVANSSDQKWEPLPKTLQPQSHKSREASTHSMTSTGSAAPMQGASNHPNAAVLGAAMVTAIDVPKGSTDQEWEALTKRMETSNREVEFV